MNQIFRSAACSAVIITVMMLAGCNRGPATQVASSTPLEITEWGPQTTKAGAVFNKQPNGSAAMWIKMNRSLSGDEAWVDFGGTKLQAVVTQDLVTVAIPEFLYAKAGTYSVHVVAKGGAQELRSNDVKFTVN